MSINSRSEFIPTIIDSRPLLPRLASELSALEHECRLAWPELKQHPVRVGANLGRAMIRRSRRVLFAPNVLAALLTVAVVVVTVVLTERTIVKVKAGDNANEDLLAEQVNIINLDPIDKAKDGNSIGRNGSGRVGFNRDRGEGSGEVRQKSGGGGGGGARESLPPQVGKLQPPSNILAAIPKTPPVTQPSLPTAGIDIDPALWKDMKAPVFGDPRSTSTASSKGPGEGEGIGTNQGLGMGDGRGPGVGPGNNGNMGGGENQRGCCGDGSSHDNNASFENRIFRGSDVEQRARLIFKPEPQYSEEARRNQITGTVMLRVVFASNGQVEQIRAIQTLPFGLTERAIAAARAIKFIPAMKGSRPVSQYMQLEYNFNLY